MLTATTVDSKKVKSQRHHGLPAPPCPLQVVAQASPRLACADVTGMAVREERAQTTGISCSDGARSAAGLGRGLTIEPRVGVGEAPLLTLEPWPGEVSGDGRKIHADRAGVGKDATVEFELPVER
jgi:hypothetical protein